MINTKGELLNSETEWHQPKVVKKNLFILALKSWLGVESSPSPRLAVRTTRGMRPQHGIPSGWMTRLDL